MSSYSKTNSYSKASSSRSKSSTRTSKPFCKVCYDAGKSEREYTSHYVKSKPGDEGKVVCPYLLSLVCNYCKKKAGHTARHCPVLLEKKVYVPESRDDIKDDGWTNVSRHSNNNISQERSRLADTPPPAPAPAPAPEKKTQKKINTWAMIASGKPVVSVTRTESVPTPSPTPDALRTILTPESDSAEEEENSPERFSPAPYRYVYGAGCWADEE